MSNYTEQQKTSQQQFWLFNYSIIPLRNLSNNKGKYFLLILASQM